MNQIPESEEFAVTIEQLNSCTCRWPLWGSELRRVPPEAHYCGKPVLHEKAYCAHHMRIARRFPDKKLAD